MANELMKLNDIMTLGQALAESKYFADAKEASQAVVKILAGQELGIGPIAAMSGLYIVKGQVTLSGNIMASLIKGSGKYDYTIREHTNEVCVIEFFEENNSVGVSEFSMNDAKQAGLSSKDNWKQFPRNMLFNRALSNGAKWFCPDLFNGQSVYTKGEIEDEDDVVFDQPDNQPDLLVSGEFEAQSQERTQEQAQIDARQKWIESAVRLEGFPVDGSPAEKAEFINKQFVERELELIPVTIPEVMAL